MENEIRVEVIRAIKSKGFFVSMCIGTLVAILHFFNVVFPYRDFIYLPKISYPASVFSRWLGGEMSSVYPTLYYFLLPVLVVLPHAGSYKEDMKSGYIKQILIRTTRSKYMRAKYIVTFFIGGVVAIFPLMCNFVLTAMVFPALIPQAGTGLFPLRSFHMLGDLFYSHPYVYLLIYMIINFVFWGFFATIALAAANVCRQVITTKLFPFILYVMLYAAAEFTGYLSVAPVYFLMPTQPVKTEVSILICEILLLILIGGCYFYIGKRKDVL